MNKISSMELFWLQFMLYDSPYMLILLHYLLQSTITTAIVALISMAFLGEILLLGALKFVKGLGSKKSSWERIGIFLLKLSFFMTTIIIAAALAEMIAAEFLNLTPKWAIVALFMLPVAYLAGKDICNVAYLSVLLMPLSLVGYAILGGGNIENFSYLNIVRLPLAIFDEQGYFVFWRLMPFIAQGLGIVFLYPHLAKPQKAFKMTSIALWVNIALILFQYIMANGVFGMIESKRLLFIQIELARILQVGGNFLRVEAFSLWHWTVVGVLSAAFFVQAVSDGLKKERQQISVVLIIAGLVWLIVAVFDDLVALNFLVEIYAWFSLAVTGVGMVILLTKRKL